MPRERWLKIQELVKSNDAIVKVRDKPLESSKIQSVAPTQKLQSSLPQSASAKSSLKKGLMHAANAITTATIQEARFTLTPSLSRLVAPTVDLMAFVSFGHSNFKVETEVLTEIEDEIGSILKDNVHNPNSSKELLSTIMQAVKSALVTLSTHLVADQFAECRVCKGWNDKLDKPIVQFKLCYFSCNDNSSQAINITNSKYVIIN
ncbi:hypothetical protein Bpfe_028399 [Biomphalaria pfeifferi]|uniref:Uncharacterized protein n=1 Tax=Biomphalaria pfeifferi TaxID=112525 RepID=A0AAD8ATI3_BIOPF|nr:hypothetical protein Bpfe_028399 [Biomphalaria pfeifferi]